MVKYFLKGQVTTLTHSLFDEKGKTGLLLALSYNSSKIKANRHQTLHTPSFINSTRSLTKGSFQDHDISAGSNLTVTWCYADSGKYMSLWKSSRVSRVIKIEWNVFKQEMYNKGSINYWWHRHICFYIKKIISKTMLNNFYFTNPSFPFKKCFRVFFRILHEELSKNIRNCIFEIWI